MSSSSSAAKGKAKEQPIASLLAGAVAGGVESFVTYPLESIKTQVQFGALDGKVREATQHSLTSSLPRRIVCLEILSLKGVGRGYTPVSTLWSLGMQSKLEFDSQLMTNSSRYSRMMR
jgi:dihydroorotase-like cyclic amidohydrolase